MAPKQTMLSELREWADERINEFGDGPVRLADQLEPTWRIEVGGLEFERDKEPPAYVIASADD